MLSYATAALSVLWILFGAYPLVFSLGLGVAGWGVANERRWGYWLGIVLAGLTALGLVVAVVSGIHSLIINLLFMVVLFALYVHPQSRAYQRVWFK